MTRTRFRPSRTVHSDLHVQARYSAQGIINVHKGQCQTFVCVCERRLELRSSKAATDGSLCRDDSNHMLAAARNANAVEPGRMLTYDILAFLDLETERYALEAAANAQRCFVPRKQAVARAVHEANARLGCHCSYYTTCTQHVKENMT